MTLTDRQHEAMMNLEPEPGRPFSVCITKYDFRQYNALEKKGLVRINRRLETADLTDDGRDYIYTNNRRLDRARYR